jgi:hypothetical protein
MSEGFEATFEVRKSGANLLRLSGALDENSGLDALLHEVKPGRLALHLGNVQNFTDAGMRALVAWLATLDARGVKVDLIACSPRIVHAFNEDSQLARQARVKSIQVVYYCRKCKRDNLLVVPIAEVQKAGGAAPHRACETCVGPLIMVEDPKRYFEFVVHLPRRSAVSYDLTYEQIARGSGLRIPTQPMLTVKPSTLSTFQMLMAKKQQTTSIGPTTTTATTTDRAYIVALAIMLLFSVCGVAAMFLLL